MLGFQVQGAGFGSIFKPDEFQHEIIHPIIGADLLIADPLFWGHGACLRGVKTAAVRFPDQGEVFYYSIAAGIWGDPPGQWIGAARGGSVLIHGATLWGNKGAGFGSILTRLQNDHRQTALGADMM